MLSFLLYYVFSTVFPRTNRLYADDCGTSLETEEYEFEHTQAEERTRCKFSVCPGWILKILGYDIKKVIFYSCLKRK